MDFDIIEYWDFESAVHHNTSRQTSQIYHVFYLQ